MAAVLGHLGAFGGAVVGDRPAAPVVSAVDASSALSAAARAATPRGRDVGVAAGVAPPHPHLPMIAIPEVRPAGGRAGGTGLVSPKRAAADIVAEARSATATGELVVDTRRPAEQRALPGAASGAAWSGMQYDIG